MAIAFDASSNGGTFVSSWAHTVGAGSNRLLVVTAFDDTGGSNLLTAVTWDAAGTPQSFTKIGQVQCPGDRWTSLWYLLAPASGTKNISLTTTAGAMAGAAASYTGVGALDVSGTEASTSVNHSVTLTVATNAWIISGTKSGNTAAETWTNASERITGGNGVHFADSNGTFTGSTTTTQTQNGVTSYASAMVTASFTVAGGSGGTAYTQTLTDTVTFSDTLVKRCGKVLSETTTFSDTLIRRCGKILSETATYSDVVNKFITKIPFTETVTFSDLLTTTKVVLKALSETLTFSDSLVRSTGKALVEVLTFSDIFSRIGTFRRTLTETLTFSDLVAALWNGVVVALVGMTCETFYVPADPTSSVGDGDDGFTVKADSTSFTDVGC